MNIEITGQGTQLYPHKSYHTGVTINTYTVLENGAAVQKQRYQLNVGKFNFVSMDDAKQIQSIPEHVNPGGIKMAPDMVFNGQNGNVYLARHVYVNGNVSGMSSDDAMVYPDWYNAFGQQFGY